MLWVVQRCCRNSARHWESFHARWAASIADALNTDLLPADYFAEVQVHVGSRNALVHLLEVGEQFLLPEAPLYTTAYHPVRHADAEEINVWAATLAVGQPLPLLPLPLDKALFVPLDLGATYSEACQRTRLA